MPPSSYERYAQKLLRGIPPSKPFVVFSNGRISIGTQSKHRTKQGCMWRLFWRIKANRNKVQSKQ